MRRLLTSFILGGAVAISPVAMPSDTGPDGSLSLLPKPAQADSLNRGEVRRTVRRTARRIDRRQDRRTGLPGGCVYVVINDRAYWRCGSIYYQEIIDNGVTVYVIVEP